MIYAPHESRIFVIFLTGDFNCKVKRTEIIWENAIRMIKKHKLMMMENHQKLETKSILDYLIIK